MEIRTRKIIRRYVTKDGGGIFRRPKVLERDEYYYNRHAQRTRSEESHSPSYRIIETREPLRSRSSPSPLRRRDTSPIRSKPFIMRMPYTIRRVTRRADEYEPKQRGRDRSPRTFVVDPPPETPYAWPKSERRRSPSPNIRYISPRRKPTLRRVSPRRPSPRRPAPPPLRRETETTVVVENTPRESRSLERRKGPRPPRERTPVVEREPVRRRPAAVEIHQSPERRREHSGSTGRRQVRFAEDINREDFENRARKNEEYSLSESDIDYRDETRRRIHERRVRRDLDDTPRHRYVSPERRTYRITDLPRPSVRSSRLRPQIIQDGNREISEDGDRIYAEARRRREQERRQLREVVPHSSSRWRRHLDGIRDFSSDDDEYYSRGIGSRRYGRRWL
ncbi:putative RNA binding protein [Aspergillus mulundensis]|uniref:Uncharacterized protein n=1 Tax=Aspergillus mulundensis TaxID=1810919 RepID=A0A3D8SYM9_9EURO|nr:hypothetical protein DSM5745_02653 [Aspergillus mulundensis]RDW90878.1 hypothetical protein DSM5745_02653 [Aspergillus mulundensis]